MTDGLSHFAYVLYEWTNTDTWAVLFGAAINLPF